MDESGLNVIYVGPDTLDFGQAEFQQTIAGQMAISFIEATLGASQVFEDVNYQWWAQGLAVYLSAVLFEDGNREYLMADFLAGSDFVSPLTDRGVTVAYFLAFLHNSLEPDSGEKLGVSGVLQLLREHPNLVDYEGFEDAWHEFNRMFADGLIPDVNGEFIHVPFPFQPFEGAANGEHTWFDSLFPFSTMRLRVTVPPGQTCEATVEANGIRASHRPAAGPEGAWLPGFPRL